eukprot:SAG25_NODE_150_length_13701_cov_6.145640_3_plen_165_part_00
MLRALVRRRGGPVAPYTRLAAAPAAAGGGRKSLPSSTDSVRTARKARSRNTCYAGPGSRGHMGSAWRNSPTRHGQKLTFATWNAGGVSQLRWDIIKDLFDTTDILGLPEFTSSKGKWIGDKIADEEGGALYHPSQTICQRPFWLRCTPSVAAAGSLSRRRQRRT